MHLLWITASYRFTADGRAVCWISILLLKVRTFEKFMPATIYWKGFFGYASVAFVVDASHYLYADIFHDFIS